MYSVSQRSFLFWAGEKSTRPSRANVVAEPREKRQPATGSAPQRTLQRLGTRKKAVGRAKYNIMSKCRRKRSSSRAHRTRHQCQVCGSTRESTDEPCVHMAKHAYACFECPSKYSTNAALRQHMVTEHNRQAPTDLIFKCPECDRQHDSLASLTSHLEAEHSAESSSSDPDAEPFVDVVNQWANKKGESVRRYKRFKTVFFECAC